MAGNFAKRVGNGSARAVISEKLTAINNSWLLRTGAFPHPDDTYWHEENIEMDFCCAGAHDFVVHGSKFHVVTLHQIIKQFEVKFDIVMGGQGTNGVPLRWSILKQI